jgi:phosphatidylglycerophosphatase A
VVVMRDDFLGGLVAAVEMRIQSQKSKEEPT